jgi:cystathionine beta-lyase/cystathionine gamma-synthase
MTDKKDRKRTYHKETRLIHGDFHSPHWDYSDHIVPPISASAAYRLESTERGAKGFQSFANPEFNRHTQPPIYIYDRLDEPSRSMLEDNLAAAEEGECGVCFATGMGAISASIGVLAKSGDTVLAHRTLYGCTYSLFKNWMPRFGITVKMVDCKDVEALEAMMTDDVVAVYLETPSNPVLEIVDIAAIRAAVDRVNANRGKKRRIFIVVDNTFATPFCQRPITLGADVVVQSITKNVGGFGTDMGGVWVGPTLLEPDVLLFRKDIGAPLAPKAAWPPLVYGLPTLGLRSRQQMDTALKVARFLEGHPAVKRVVYPGLPSHPQHVLARKQMLDAEGNFAPGIMIYFELKGDLQEARTRGSQMMDYLADQALTITLAVSLGQIRTLIEHPSSMTHAPLPVEAQLEAGIDPGGIRISVGLEKSEDIMGDLEDALDALT